MFKVYFLFMFIKLFSFINGVLVSFSQNCNVGFYVWLLELQCGFRFIGEVDQINIGNVEEFSYSWSRYFISVIVINFW